MKTSIIINPVAFRAELYKCFFWYRPFVIHGNVFTAVPSYAGTDFIVSLFNMNGVDPRAYHKQPLGEAIYNYKFSANDCVAMRSTSPEDYYNMFFAECSFIEREMEKFIPNETTHVKKVVDEEIKALSLKHRAMFNKDQPNNTVGLWNGVNDVPDDSEEGASEDVLIDMDGKRKNFQIGWYDHDEKKWCFHVHDTSNFDAEKMEWRHIPK